MSLLGGNGQPCRRQPHRHGRRRQSALGNSRDGVEIESGATGNTIGGTYAGAANLIAFNAGSGVAVGLGADASLDNPILEDSIFSNEDLGIAIDNSEPQSAPCWVSP